MNAEQFVLKLAQTVVNPIITLLFSVALVVFSWGVIEYIKGAESSESRQKGQQHIIWGLVGLLIMVGVYTIIDAAKKTILAG